MANSDVIILENMASFLCENGYKPLASDMNRRASVVILLRLRNSEGKRENQSSVPSINGVKGDGKGLTRDAESVKVFLKNARKSVHNYKLDILYMLRASRKNDRWSGQVGFPGGHHDEEDGNSDWTTAVRETREEVGIELTSGDFCMLGRLDDRKIIPFNHFLRVLCPFVFLQTTLQSQKLELDPNEVAASRWVPFEFFTQQASTRLTPIQMDLPERLSQIIYRNKTSIVWNRVLDVVFKLIPEGHQEMPSLILPDGETQLPVSDLRQQPLFQLWGMTLLMTNSLLSMTNKALSLDEHVRVVTPNWLLKMLFVLFHDVFSNGSFASIRFAFVCYFLLIVFGLVVIGVLISAIV